MTPSLTVVSNTSSPSASDLERMAEQAGWETLDAALKAADTLHDLILKAEALKAIPEPIKDALARWRADTIIKSNNVAFLAKKARER